jgi:hypothetical protein
VLRRSTQGDSICELKIGFIGAGNLGFARGVVRDNLIFSLLADATISLMDIDPERLDFTRRAVEKIARLCVYQPELGPHGTAWKPSRARVSSSPRS